jgi:hypothetical protein
MMQRSALDRSELIANEPMITIQRNLCGKERLFKAALFSKHEFTESQFTAHISERVRVKGDWLCK